MRQSPTIWGACKWVNDFRHVGSNWRQREQLVSLNSAQGQSYPAKQVRWIVAYGAGGATDSLARIIGPKLSDLWGQQVVHAGGTLVPVLDPGQGRTKAGRLRLSFSYHFCVRTEGTGSPLYPHRRFLQGSPAKSTRSNGVVHRTYPCPVGRSAAGRERS